MINPVRVLIRCDGSLKVGMGHIVRCLALADTLKFDLNCDVAFAVREDSTGIDLIRKKNYRIFVPANNSLNFDYSSWIFEIIGYFMPQVFLMDVRDDLPLELIKKIKERKILVVTIDDPSDRRLYSDLAFYPPVHQVKKMDWTGYEGKLYVGWEWVLLRPEFSIQKKARTTSSAVPIILITMGGSDPEGMTLVAVQALERIEQDLLVRVILGPAFSHRDALFTLLQDSKHRYEVMDNVENMADTMRAADIAVVSFGVTAYELAAIGVPSLYLCRSPDHVLSANSLVDEGYGINLGEYNRISPLTLCQKICSFLRSSYNGKQRFRKGQGSIDGLGNKRVALRIMEELNL